MYGPPHNQRDSTLSRSEQLRVLRRRFTRRWVSGIWIGIALLAIDWLGHRRILDTAMRRSGDSAATSDAFSQLDVSNNILGGAAALALVGLALFMFRPLDKTLRAESRLLEEVEAAEHGEARRQRFATELHEALEMAENEDRIGRVVEHVLAVTVPDYPAELLLADSSEAHLTSKLIHPLAGQAGCSVTLPFECPAVKRAASQTFRSSTAINACPHLRDRAGGDRSALCAPVAFMGRSLGVLHVTAPDTQPPSDEESDRIGVLASQIGTAIGTVRAFAKAQLQASTDSLTGLLNRRSAEDQVARRLSAGEPFAIVMADLDHFKLLNDTYGHEAGDRALRLFAETLRRALRAGDIVARWGGEEFVIALPGTDCASAVELLDRVRLHLAATCDRAETPTVTSSFGVADTTMSSQFDELLGLADGALQTAKARGRNRVERATTIAADTEVIEERLPVSLSPSA